MGTRLGRRRWLYPSRDCGYLLWVPVPLGCAGLPLSVYLSHLLVCLWAHDLAAEAAYAVGWGTGYLSLATRAYRHSGACAGLPTPLCLSHVLECPLAHDPASQAGYCWRKHGHAEAMATRARFQLVNDAVTGVPMGTPYLATEAGYACL